MTTNNVQSQSVKSTVEFLLSLGLRPLPVAPKHETDKRFTGKNPSYIDASGNYRIVSHSKYQKQDPTEKELTQWFSNDSVGVGTLGGINNIYFIDLDRKQFNDQESCDDTAMGIVAKISENSEGAWVEKTQSGGYRIAIRLVNKPTFTNFGIEGIGGHLGELIGNGRFVVLAPTKGECGNYELITENPSVPTIEDISLLGIVPTKKALQKSTQESIKNISIDLLALLSDNAKSIYDRVPTENEDRSTVAATLGQEIFGWENWLTDKGMSSAVSAETLFINWCLKAGADEAKSLRYIKSFDFDNVMPSLHTYGDFACWKKIQRASLDAFSAKCPQNLKDQIRAESEQNYQIVDPKEVSKSPLMSLVHRSMELSDLEIDAELLRISQASKISIGYLKEIYNRELSAYNGELVIEDVSKDFSALLEAQNYKLNLAEVFPRKLARSLAISSNHWRIDPSRLILGLKSAVGICLGSRVMVLSDKDNDTMDVRRRAQACNSFGIDVSISGSGKGEALSAIFSPLSPRNEKIQKDWTEESNNLDINIELAEDKAERVKLKQRRNKMGDAAPKLILNSNETIQAAYRVASALPPRSGIGYIVDEFRGMTKGMGQFSGGVGNTWQTLITLWDKPMRESVTKSKQAGGTVMPDYQTLNIFGGLQPQYLIDLVQMTDQDADGSMSRYWFDSPQDHHRIIEDYSLLDSDDSNLYSTLMGLYDWLWQVGTESEVHYQKISDPGLIKLSKALTDCKRQYFNLREDHRMLAQQYNRFVQKSIRDCLAHHYIECYFAGLTPIQAKDLDISEHTVDRVLKINMLFMNRTRVLYAQYGNATYKSEITGEIKQVYDYLSDRAKRGLHETTIRQIIPNFVGKGNRASINTAKMRIILKSLESHEIGSFDGKVFRFKTQLNEALEMMASVTYNESVPFVGIVPETSEEVVSEAVTEQPTKNPETQSQASQGNDKVEIGSTVEDEQGKVYKVVNIVSGGAHCQSFEDKESSWIRVKNLRVVNDVPSNSSNNQAIEF